MNRFTLAFLILFFIVTLAIGLFAIKDTFLLTGEAGQNCPSQQIPPPDFCPEGQTAQIDKDAKGCIRFVCR